MDIERRFCSNHPQRPAIGVCVMTRVPICGECSTRYEGVNYSKEGLRLLQQQRAVATAGGRSRKRLVTAVLAWCLAPLMLYLMYLAYLATAQVLATMLHPES